MSRYPRNFGRRQFLVGAGGLLMIPMLESIVSRSARAAVAKAAAADVPQRFMQVHSCHGWFPDDWIPSKVGADFPLTKVLQPLQNVKEKVLVFSKMQNDAALKCKAPGGFDTHARGNATLFTGANVIAGKTVQVGPSMDQIYAQSLVGKFQGPSFQFGLKQQWDEPAEYSVNLMQYVSYRSKTEHLVDALVPQKVFTDNFLGAKTDAEKQIQELIRQQRKSVLDGVLDQANALKGKLGQDDAARLDQYFTGVRELELQFSTSVNPSCSVGPQPEVLQQDDYDALTKSFMDLTVLAFSCDLARSVSFNFGSGHNDHRYKFVPGGVFDGHHGMTHNLGDKRARSMITAVNTWEVASVARMCEGLKAIPEGGGTMLDNSITMIATEMAIAGEHGYQEQPLVLIGGGGGNIDGNRHVQGGSGSNYGNMTEVQLAALQALGVNITSFGGFNTTRAMSLKA